MIAVFGPGRCESDSVMHAAGARHARRTSGRRRVGICIGRETFVVQIGLFYAPWVDAHALDCYRKAGRIASECREWAREHVRPGVRIRDVLETVEQKIRERGGEP